MKRLSCFKAYDIRGRLGEEVTVDLARSIGRAYAGFVKPKRVAIGHDIRLSSPELAQAVTDGLCMSGVDVVNLGRCGTEEVYFASAHLALDGGIMVTASHNPKDYNGFKLVREDARPISADTGLAEIERAVVEKDFPAIGRGRVEYISNRPAYVEHILGYVDRQAMKALHIVVNAGNGGAGEIIDLLEAHLSCTFAKLYHEPDGNFPHGIPNPLLPDNRAATTEAVVRERAAFGVAWDGDFDRCFFYDERGEFIEGYYLVGLLAEHLLRGHPRGKIVHDPRLVWNTIDVVGRAGGVPIQCKSGHAFMKDMMRGEDAIYGGEMSAHHYFRDFCYADSGMIPWLVVYEIVSRSGRTLSELVADRVRAFPVSGEINTKIDDARGAIERLRAHYAPLALALDETDGVSLEFERWRFNVRMSNTEPYVRLNVESRGDRELMLRMTDEVLARLEGRAVPGGAAA